MAILMTPAQTIVDAIFDTYGQKGGYRAMSIAAVCLDAIDDGWAKVDGEWVRMVTFDVQDDDGETLTVWAKEA